MGGFITQHVSWPYIFWAVSIADAVVQVLGFFFLRETYAPKILADKAERLRRTTGNPKLHTEWQKPEHGLGHVLRKNLVRPFIMLTTQPAIQTLALYRAYFYGIKYLV